MHQRLKSFNYKNKSYLYIFKNQLAEGMFSFVKCIHLLITVFVGFIFITFCFKREAFTLSSFYLKKKKKENAFLSFIYH